MGVCVYTYESKYIKKKKKKIFCSPNWKLVMLSLKFTQRI